jgi:hypothetical protein
MEVSAACDQRDVAAVGRRFADVVDDVRHALTAVRERVRQEGHLALCPARVALPALV